MDLHRKMAMVFPEILLYKEENSNLEHDCVHGTARVSYLEWVGNGTQTFISALTYDTKNFNLFTSVSESISLVNKNGGHIF